MVLPRSRSRFKRLTVTVYDDVAAAIAVVVNDMMES
jgi:hypothetical protein